MPSKMKPIRLLVSVKFIPKLILYRPYAHHVKTFCEINPNILEMHTLNFKLFLNFYCTKSLVTPFSVRWEFASLSTGTRVQISGNNT